MKWLKDYFDLSRREERGLIALICVVIFLFALQFAWVYVVPHKNVDLSPTAAHIDNLNEKERDTVDNQDNSTKNSIGKLRNFDPNIIDEEGFVKMGLSPIVASHFIHYREKGGHFYKPDDLKKIYGLTDDMFNTIKPFIVISSVGQKTADVMVDLNKADSIQLLAVKGIGPVFAAKILNMRTGLGSFVNKNQLLDIYGIDALRYEYIENQVFVSKSSVHKLNINIANAKDLQENPYIKYKLANIIVKYREANGPYRSIEDLKKIYAIDEKTLEKMRPYLSIN